MGLTYKFLNETLKGDVIRISAIVNPVTTHTFATYKGSILQLIHVTRERKL